MKALSTLLALGLTSALSAQSLQTLYAANNGLGAVGGVLFFNMTVNVPDITVYRLDVNCQSVAGVAGSVRLWQTNTGIPTFNGSELNAANWTLLGEAPGIASGVIDTATTCCFPTPITLSASLGTRGYAVEYVDLAPAYTNGTGTNQNYSNAQLTLSAGASAGRGPWYPDGLAAPFLAAPFNPRVFNGEIFYTVGTSATPCSYSERYSTGCGKVSASWFDLIEDPAVASTTLPGNQLIFVPDNPGAPAAYSVTKVPGSLIPTTGHPVLNGTFATTIAASPGPDDDGEVAVPISAPFAFPGGTTSSLVVHTNGMVSVASNLAFLDGLAGDDWAPLVPGLLQAPNTAWYSWHDYDASAASGGGTITAFDDVAQQQLVVTWNGVESYPAGAGNPSTLQMVVNYASGIVSIYWDSIAAVGVGGAGDEHLVGYSPGSAQLRPDEGDIVTLLSDNLGNPAAERDDLLLTSDARPVIGSTIQYNIANVPAIGIGLLFFSTSNPNPFPGTDISFTGITAPGCLINFDIAANVDGSGLGFVFFADGPVGPGLDTSTITPTLLGVELWVQAVHLLGDGVNLFPALTSNAIHQRVENS